jgi:uncharacterized protein
MDTRVFLDASFWIAYRNAREPGYVQAQAVLRRLFLARTRFVTTLPVFCEIQAYFSRHPGRRRTILADLWQNPVVQFENISSADQEAAIELLRQHQDKSFSLCDALSFVVMGRLGVKRVATFDGHFRQAGGFEIVE